MKMREIGTTLQKLYKRKVYNPTQMPNLDSDAQRLKGIRKWIHVKSKSRSERRENVRQSARFTLVLRGIDTNLDSISEENSEKDFDHSQRLHFFRTFSSYVLRYERKSKIYSSKSKDMRLKILYY